MKREIKTTSNGSYNGTGKIIKTYTNKFGSKSHVVKYKNGEKVMTNSSGMVRKNIEGGYKY